MEIFYFNTQGEKIGPITKEGLVNLAKAGVVGEQTVFEIGGKKVKGKHIKNLRPIFEGRSAVAPSATAERETAADPISVPAPDAALSETDVPENIYRTAAQETGPSDVAKAADQHRMRKVQDNDPLFDTYDDASTSTSDFIGQVKEKLTSDKTKEAAAAFKTRVFTKFWSKKNKNDATVSEQPKEVASSPQEETKAPPAKETAATRRRKRAESIPKDRVFTKFWRGYRLLTIFLHLVFVIALLFCLAGLCKGAKWKFAGTMGYRSLNSNLEDLLKTHTYEEFAREVDRLDGVRPFRFIEGILNKWNAPTSFEERTEKLLSGRDKNKIQSFEEMIAYLKKATEATYASEVDEVKTAVENQKDYVAELRKKIEELKAKIRAREQKEKPRETTQPSTEKSHKRWDDIQTTEPKEPTDPILEELRELEERLKRAEERLRAEEARLRELQSAATLQDRGKIIDTLAPEMARPYETEDEEIVVTPKSVGELHDVVHSYMKMMSLLFDEIHETGTNTFNLHKIRAVEILGGYLLLLFLCYFTATRARMAEETQITRLILENRLDAEKPDGND